MNKLRYDVIAIAHGRPQPRRPLNPVDAAAILIAEKHMAGHVVKCLTNALTLTVNRQRQEGLAKRVNKILAKKGFTGEPWQP